MQILKNSRIFGGQMAKASGGRKRDRKSEKSRAKPLELSEVEKFLTLLKFQATDIAATAAAMRESGLSTVVVDGVGYMERAADSLDAFATKFRESVNIAKRQQDLEALQ